MEEEIKKQEKEFDKEFCTINDLGQQEVTPIRVHNYSRKDPITTNYAILRNDIINWHKQSIKNLLEAEVEILKENKRLENNPEGYDGIIDNYVIDAEQTISHLENIIKSLLDK